MNRGKPNQRNELQRNIPCKSAPIWSRQYYSGLSLFKYEIQNHCLGTLAVASRTNSPFADSQDTERSISEVLVQVLELVQI